MLELYALLQLPSQTIPQENGAPLHFSHHVRNHLDREMVGRWTDRDGPIACPPRSPDLTPMDLFLWGYMKNIDYKVKINDLQHLKARHAVTMLTPNMFTQRGTRSNIVWIFVVPPREPTLKFIEKVIYSEKNFDSFPL
jgi:hypothetical protein